ncbi:hypothetical protein HDV00_002498 [Rhizophlyctis rosea]|nr:hypothetical protein HDV00_002498 [Rhizophlyctis rosea]
MHPYHIFPSTNHRRLAVSGHPSVHIPNEQDLPPGVPKYLAWELVYRHPDLGAAVLKEEIPIGWIKIMGLEWYEPSVPVQAVGRSATDATMRTATGQDTGQQIATYPKADSTRIEREPPGRHVPVGQKPRTPPYAEEQLENLGLEAMLESPLQLLLRFNQLQSARVGVYKDLETGFSLYTTREATPEEYQTLVKKITGLFASISQEVQDVETALAKIPRTDLAGLIRDIQNLEKRKLEQSETIFGQRDLSDELNSLSSSVEETVTQINEKLEDIQAEIAELAE